MKSWGTESFFEVLKGLIIAKQHFAKINKRNKYKNKNKNTNNQKSINYNSIYGNNNSDEENDDEIESGLPNNAFKMFSHERVGTCM
jgi:hypothetical protein